MFITLRARMEAVADLHDNDCKSARIAHTNGHFTTGKVNIDANAGVTKLAACV